MFDQLIIALVLEASYRKSGGFVHCSREAWAAGAFGDDDANWHKRAWRVACSLAKEG